MNIKSVLKSSVAVAALFAIAAPAANAEIKSGNKNTLKISGQVVRAIWHADDGHSDETFITGSGQDTASRVRWIASGKLNENVTAGATIEMNIPLASSQGSSTLQGATVGADGTSNGAVTTWGIRHEYVWVKHKKFGKLTLGQTSTASDGASAPSLGRVGDNGRDSQTFGSGLTYINRNTAAAPALSPVTIGEAHTSFDGGRDDNIRYDTPTFMGLHAKVAIIQGGGWDTALYYSSKFGAFRIVARAGYDNSEAQSRTAPWAAFGGIAVKHDSGLSASYGGGKRSFSIKDSNPGEVNRDNDPHFINWTVGYAAKLFGVGGTQFGVSYTNAQDNVTDIGDEQSDATIWSVGVGQKFDAIGASMQLSYANHEFDSKTFAGNANTFDDIDVISLQTIFKF